MHLWPLLLFVSIIMSDCGNVSQLSSKCQRKANSRYSDASDASEVVAFIPPFVIEYPDGLNVLYNAYKSIDAVDELIVQQPYVAYVNERKKRILKNMPLTSAIMVQDLPLIVRRVRRNGRGGGCANGIFTFSCRYRMP